MINEKLLKELKKITKEEEQILNGRQGIEKEIYMSTASSYSENNVIDAKKLLDSGQKLMIDVLGYIEEHYRDGELQQLAEMMNYDVYFLSKEIKKITGRNYTDLLQEKRLNQAAYLLEHTTMSVMDVGLAVGYDNLSYFHRIFQKHFGTTPRKYRMSRKNSSGVEG